MWMNLKKNYWFSGWIANLGVVPLLRFLALRLLPTFFILRCLLISVALVLETMVHLPIQIDLSLSGKDQYLPGLAKTVKNLLCLVFFVTFLQTLTLPLSAQTPPQHSSFPQTIVLSKGEQRELAMVDLDKFSVGQAEVLSYRHLPAKKSLLIKGKMMGFTDLVVWPKKGGKITYHIYVLSKQGQLKMLSAIESLSHLNISARPFGTMIVAEGKIENREQYRSLLKLRQSLPQASILRLTLGQELRNQLIAEVYLAFWRENITDLSCHDDGLTIACQYSAATAISPEVLKNLSQQMAIDAVLVKNRFQNKNFLVKFKLIQMEQLEGKEFTLGLHQLVTDLGELYQNGLKGALAKNRMVLAELNMDVSTLAEPEIMVRTDVPAVIELGQEIPYRTTSGGNALIPQVSWKFAGLRIKFTLKESGPLFLLEYESEMSRPDGESISGSKQVSHVVLKAGVPLQISQIAHKTDVHFGQSFPLLHNIPILGEIFKSKSDSNNYKKIIAVVTLE